MGFSPQASPASPNGLRAKPWGRFLSLSVLRRLADIAPAIRPPRTSEIRGERALQRPPGTPPVLVSCRSLPRFHPANLNGFCAPQWLVESLTEFCAHSAGGDDFDDFHAVTQGPLMTIGPSTFRQRD